MDKYVELIKILEKLFGKGAVSRTIGTRTNVIRFPKGKQGLNPTKSEFDVEGTYAKNPDLVQTIENSIEDRMGDITQMNDQELLTYTSNARRLLNFKEPPTETAEIIKFGSGQEIKGKGLETLIEKQGTKFSPTTDLGKLEAAGKRLEKAVEEMSPEFLAKQEAERQAMIARQYEGKGFAGGVFGPSGMYRAVARNFLLDEAAKGKIKLSPDTIKNLQERSYISGGQPLMYADPIRIMRYHYGDDVFEKIPLDKIPTGAPSEIKEVMSKVEAPPIRTEPPKTPGGYLTPGEYRANIEEMQKIEDAIKRRESRFADMTEEEIQNELAQYGGKRSAFEMGLEQDYPEEFAKYKKPKDIDEPEEKANGGRIGFSKGKKVMSEIDKLIEQLNKKTKGKKSMESVNPKTGEVTVPKRPIRRAEEPTGTTVMDPEPETVDERSIPKTKTVTKILDENSLRKLAQKENLNPEELEKFLSGEYNQIKRGPQRGLITRDKEGNIIIKDKYSSKYAGYNQAIKQKYDEDIIKAADNIYPNYDDPKIAADQIVDSYAQMKYGLEDQYGLSNKERMDLYTQAYDYVMDHNRKIKSIYKKGDPITEENFGSSPFAPSQETLNNLKIAREQSKKMSEQELQNEMNRVLNQYDKSMFVKNEFGAVDITSEENQRMMAMLLKRDHPELYNQIYNLGEDLSQKQILDEFDITGREPNAKGGIAGLL